MIGTSKARHESGQVVVFFALLLPVIFAIGAVVIDLGNWFVHKRHLQTQVDAAAIASGPEFTWCFLEPASANTLIKQYALRYAGDVRRDPDAGNPTLEHNRQLQEPNDVYTVLNANRYWPDSSNSDPATGYGLDESMDGDPSDPDPDSSAPCDAAYLDVKATDDRAPLLWGLIPVSPSPKARAKVEIFKEHGRTGFLPWAVPENDPRTVAVLFVDETQSPNQPPSSYAFLTRPTSDTLVNGQAARVWSGSAEVDVVDETGMIVLQSSAELTNTDLDGKTLDEICTMQGSLCISRIRNQSPPTNNRSSVGFIFGEQGTPSPNAVTIRFAGLTDLDDTGTNFGPGSPSCLGQDSSPYFLWEDFGNCQIRIQAQLDFGANIPATAREVHVLQNGTFGGNCNTGPELILRDGYWESPWMTIVESSGRNDFRLCWRAGTGGGRRDGNFNNQVIQMAFSANTDSRASNTAYSGPLVYTTVQPLHSLAKTLQTITVEVGLSPPLQLTDGTVPPIYLRISGRGSLNQMLDCDPPNRGPDEEIRDGCQTPYTVNTRNLSCGGPGTPVPNPQWDQSNLPPSLSPEDPAWVTPDCIEANPGDVTSMAKGLRARFEDPPPTGAACPPNRWREYRSAGTLPTTADKRLVTLVIANFGEFDDQGIKPLPITKFAGFYVTGWFVGGGGQGTTGCPSLPAAVANDPPPTPPFCAGVPCAPDSQRVQGAVWGYFVTQVDPPGAGIPGPERCVFSELGKCVAVLVE